MVEKDMYNVDIRKYKLVEESFNMQAVFRLGG